MLSPAIMAKIEANRQAALAKKRRHDVSSDFGGNVIQQQLQPEFSLLESSAKVRTVMGERNNDIIDLESPSTISIEITPHKSAQSFSHASAVLVEREDTPPTKMRNVRGTSTQKPLQMVVLQPESTQPHEFSIQQQQVWAEVMSGKSCFLTGCGGTGKSFLTNQLIFALKGKYGKASVAVTATTGIAACQIGGTTVHTFAGIGIANESVEELIEHVMKNKRTVERWKKTRCLVIDEISMLDGEFFDKLEAVARAIRRVERPFGGLQLLLVGDFLQLPPVAKKDGQRSFCFDAAAWDKAIEVNIELTEVFRQRNHEFIDTLNSLRVGVCTPQMSEKLRLTQSSTLNEESGVQATRIYARNVEVENINYRKVCELPGKMTVLSAQDDGELQYLKNLDANCLAPKLLHLKPGAQVMLLKNIDTEAGLTNGTRGVVASIEEVEDQKHAEVIPRVSFDTKNGIITRLVRKEVFSSEAQGRVVASRTQFPLRLAYAITIHKCQGMTLSKVEISLKDVFEYGQAYVALSRVADLSGLRLLDFSPAVVKAHPHVLNFYKNMQTRRTRMPADAEIDLDVGIEATKESLPVFKASEMSASSPSKCMVCCEPNQNKLFLYD